MKILFMGTPEFSAYQLKGLIENGYHIVGVLTQPDKPKGRGHKLTPSAVKVVANEHNIPVFQPETLRNNSFVAQLDMLNPDIIIVVAYGQILPEYVLNFPKFGCINLHASLLPKYRGAAPIQWAIMNGETRSGNTTMYMAKGVDTGDMLLKSTVEIDENMTGEQLHDALMKQGVPLLIETIKRLENRSIKGISQENEETVYAVKLDKEICRINWNDSAVNIVNKIRGLNPFPTAFTMFDNKILKVYKGVKAAKNLAIGEFLIEENKIFVGCSDGAVELLEIMMQGKKRCKTEDFLRGYRK